MHAARAHGHLAVKLIAGHGAGDEQREPLPGRPDAGDDLALRPGLAPNPGTSLRRPWVIQRAEYPSDGQARGHHGRAGPTAVPFART
jgi:hypothetical protein